jgi:hypothetical protein
MTARTELAELGAFDQGWLEVLQRTPFVRLVYGLGGLTRLGERPVHVDRLALVPGRSLDETTTLVQENTSAGIEDGLIWWDDPFPGDQVRRMLYVGDDDRPVPMKSGCAPDLTLYAGVLDVPFRVEDTCAAAGVLIRIDFIPDGVERVDPPHHGRAAAPRRAHPRRDRRQLRAGQRQRVHLPAVRLGRGSRGMAHATPGGRVFTVAEMFEPPWYRYFRDDLRPFIHPPVPG